MQYKRSRSKNEKTPVVTYVYSRVICLHIISLVLMQTAVAVRNAGVAAQVCLRLSSIIIMQGLYRYTCPLPTVYTPSKPERGNLVLQDCEKRGSANSWWLSSPSKYYIIMFCLSKLYCLSRSSKHKHLEVGTRN